MRSLKRVPSCEFCVENREATYDLGLGTIERGVSTLLRASFRLIVTEAGGSALDIDSEEDYEIARLRYTAWWKAQCERAERLYASAALPERSAVEPPR